MFRGIARIFIARIGILHDVLLLSFTVMKRHELNGQVVEVKKAQPKAEPGKPSCFRFGGVGGFLLLVVGNAKACLNVR